MRDFTVSVIQFSNYKHKKLDDAAKIILMITRKIEQLTSTDLVVLPEMTTTPYIMTEQYIYDACRRYDTEMDIYKKIAKRSKKYILAASVRRKQDNVYNTAFLIAPDGRIIGEYNKTHIPAREQKTFVSGDNFFVIRTPIATFGILICYDAHFPESFRILKQMGAEVVLLPINSAVESHEVNTDIDNWAAICKYNALVNSLYLVMANKIGEIGTSHIFHTGYSTIVSPFGEVLARATAREDNVTAKLSVNCFEKYQNTYSMHKRDDLYEKYIDNKRDTKC